MTDIQLFLQRIELDPATPIDLSLDLLGRIQTACVTSIAYENLDILDQEPLDLTPEALFDKIVLHGRGGYCFELNGLLSCMLRVMGYTVSERFARYLRGEATLPMRRHRIVIVTLGDGDYLCDIGVGQIAPRLPLKIEAGLVQTQNGETYKFEIDPTHGWILYDLHDGSWREYICFTNDPAYDVDFIQPSFYCEAHIDSVFNKDPMIAIKTPAGRKTIDGDVYKVFVGEELEYLEEGISDARYKELLRTEFKLKV